MAEVWLARAFGASGFEKLVALKTLLPAFVGEADLERLLIEEARLGGRLAHRNLVQVHDLGISDGRYYVAMDYVDGGDLTTLGRPLSEGLALLVLDEVAAALEYLHRLTDERGRPLGLVHRDVSPSNVLLSTSGEAKLADFGIAKATVLADTTRASIRRGKYAYMSPEQVAGLALTGQSDQFGLGVMMAELLTGDRPYDGDSPLETMEKIKVADPPALPDLSPDLRAIARRCLMREPPARFRDASELRRVLAEARRRRALFTSEDLGHAVRGTREGGRATHPPPTEELTGQS